MSNSLINRRDLDFQLFEVLDTLALTAHPRFAEHSRETFTAVLDTAQAIATDKFAPHNRSADENEPHLEDGRVRMVPEIGQAIDAFVQAGFLSASYDFLEGGMQLPAILSQSAMAIFASANMATTVYSLLSMGNASVIHRYGSEAQKKLYFEPLMAGRFFGTMALTESQAGSSLADLKTSATPNADGSYAIRGNKIFISGGDHELSENIVHLVLARIDGAPPGVKGISLFIVPKFRVQPDGSLGPRNDVALTGLIHKMGCRGATSTLLAFGEKGECRGDLVGEPHKGLSYMFHMMNQIRIGAGLGAVMLGYRGYQASLAYAKERLQGRAPTSKNPAEPPLPIIEHGDVRRMLMAQKAYVEGGLALCLFCAHLIDTQTVSADETERREAAMLLDLLTPVTKSWPSQWCLEGNSLAIQIHGGYGYTRDYPVEQFYRDNRLNAIHEGTHGIQALDLLGRKAFMQGGAASQLLAREIGKTLEQADEVAELQEFTTALNKALMDMVSTLQTLGAAMLKEPNRALANASVFLEAFGHTVIAWMWLRQAVAACRALALDATVLDATEQAFYQGKLSACRWFYRWELPKTRAWHELLRSLDDTVLTMPCEGF